jgi:hypothetical protein
LKKEEKKMNIKSKLLWLSASLTLMGSMIAPAIADEWDKETKLEFSAPVEVPGQVLAAGKYVFRLLDSESDRNIVEIFSEDANGNQKLVTTIPAIPDYRQDTPDKPVVNFEERASGSPEAIHSWFYPGDNTGWAFVYPKAERLVSSNTTAAVTPAPAPPSAPAPASAPTPAPAPTSATAPAPAPAMAATRQPVASVTISEDDVAIIAQNDQPELLPDQSRDTQEFADRTLPQTAGYSGLELMTGLGMLAGGIAAVFASRRKAQA